MLVYFFAVRSPFLYDEDQVKKKSKKQVINQDKKQVN